MEQRNENKTGIEMIKMSDVQPAWNHLGIRLSLYGKLTIIQGDR